jgi:hypothetical protein
MSHILHRAVTAFATALLPKGLRWQDTEKAGTSKVHEADKEPGAEMAEDAGEAADDTQSSQSGMGDDEDCEEDVVSMLEQLHSVAAGDPGKLMLRGRALIAKVLSQMSHLFPPR